MVIENSFIADRFSLLSRLMDIHGENPFKTKSYSSAAFTIDKLPGELHKIPRESIFSIRGIGSSIGRQVVEILDSGELQQLNEIISRTPPGVLEMLRIKGLGPKKIATVWKEMEIESIGELMYACNENRLLLYKGFGEKTQDNIRDTISFYLKNQGSFLFAEVEGYLLGMQKKLAENFPGHRILVTGEFRRHLEIINKAEWVTTIPPEDLAAYFEKNGLSVKEASDRFISFSGPERIDLTFYTANPENFFLTLFNSSAGDAFLESWQKESQGDAGSFLSEEEIFSSQDCAFIPPVMRETASVIARAKRRELPNLIQTSDIRGIIHSHSTWSDGSESIAVMAAECIRLGYEYLVISDHSKTAFYANGLQEARILEQHRAIDELNASLAPFKVFKSIESDILNDGSLDYSDQMLSTFDLVIASVHSNLKMTKEKAMARLLRAIENPHTTILGHMTGRLLLSRPGYPVDHTAVIDACAANKVVIELNAHPRRLDMDWRWIEYAIEKGVMISIDPDAHSLSGYHDVHYGVLAAQKAGLSKEQNLSSLGLAELTAFLSSRKQR
jgi:DNA polymerase (family X)